MCIIGGIRHEERILEHGGRLDRRVVLQATAGVRAQGRGAEIGPDVRSAAALPPEFDVVDVGRVAFLERRQKFMLRAIEAAHAGVGLGPEIKVEGR
jgi:hypothetical protein